VPVWNTEQLSKTDSKNYNIETGGWRFLPYPKGIGVSSPLRINQHSPMLIIAPITSTIGKLYPFEIFLSHGLSILLERKCFSSKNCFGKISFEMLQFLSMTPVLLPVFQGKSLNPDDES
jgi:hypothetical protein